MKFLNLVLAGVFAMSLIPVEEAFACKDRDQSKYDKKRDELKRKEGEHKEALARCDAILKTVGKTLEDANKCKLNSANMSRQRNIESLKTTLDTYKSKGCK
jgi:hypothetical protein